MKVVVTILISLSVLILSDQSYSSRYHRCDDGLSGCKSKTLLYVVPEGSIYASRIHNPRKIPEHWCPNKPHLITRAELQGDLLNAKEIKKDRSCPKFRRYTAEFWAGDPYCLDATFEERTQPDWVGEFYACTNNVRITRGEKYFFVYGIVGDGFDYLDQIIDDNRFLNDDSGEQQRGFVSFVITHEEDVPPVVRVIRSREDSLAILKKVIRQVGSDTLNIDCQIRPHNGEASEKFDALVSVRSGSQQGITLVSILENVSHGEARTALDIDACRDITFFGY